MGIVDSDRLNRFLGSPRWRDDQEEEAADVVLEVEDSLASCLNTKITPIPFSETAPIISSGLVLTTYHVYAPTRVNGVEVPDGTMPDGWQVVNHYLKMVNPPTGYSLTSQPFTLGDWAPVRHVNAVGTVQLSYMAGLGNVPALRRAILRKAAAVFENRQDESITVRDLDGNESPRVTPEEWTDEELKRLSIFYNHTVHK